MSKNDPKICVSNMQQFESPFAIFLLFTILVLQLLNQLQLDKTFLLQFINIDKATDYGSTSIT